MSDISRIKLNDKIYEIKDEEARKGLEWLLGKPEVTTQKPNDNSKDK